MHKCEHYPNMVMKGFSEFEFANRSLTDEELEHLQQVAALQRESRLQRSAHSDLCQSDLD